MIKNIISLFVLTLFTLSASAASVSSFSNPSPLLKESPVSISSLAKGTALYYSFSIPKNALNLSLTLTGTNGDADIYLNKDKIRTSKTSTWRSAKSSSNEKITIARPVSGTYYLTLIGYEASSNLSLTLRYTDATTGAQTLVKQVPVTVASMSQEEEKLFTFTLPSSTANLTVTTKGTDGDVDIYLNRDTLRSTKLSTWKSTGDTSDERIVVASASAGTYYLSLRAYTPSANTVVTMDYGTTVTPVPTPTPVSGSCGTSANQTLSASPTSNLCSTGTASSVTSGTNYAWSCTGSNGGTTANCTSSKTVVVTPVNYSLTTSATNGTITSGGIYASGTSVTLTATPATGYTFSSFTGCTSTSANTCTVLMTGNKSISASFTLTPVVTNGSCGTSANQTLSSVPTSNLCSTGTASSVTSGTSYTWTCTGAAGTAAASCTASKTVAVTPPISITGSQCNDGIDNDSDGLIDWQMDLGCEGKSGLSERAASRAEKNGFSTFDPDSTSRIIYVSNSTGNDTNDGLTPAKAVKTIVKGASLVRDGQYDFLLLKRGDVWRDQSLYDFKSGKDATHPLIIASYGSSVERPRIENKDYFINHGGRVKNYVAILGVEFYGYTGNPADPAFTGAPVSGLRYVGGGDNLLIEDTKFTYGDFIIQSYPDGVNKYKKAEVRRNSVVFAYHVNTCNQNGSFRPSGIYTSHVDGLLFEGNIYDHNGWNESVPTACATMYNHNFYVNGNDMVLKDNLITRGSSMAIKTVADAAGDVNRMIIDNNFMYDGEIGVSAGGNTSGNYRYVDVVIKNNVFSEIGKSNNTNRSFGWALDIQDHDRSLVENNYFLNQPWYTNSSGISMSSPSLRSTTIKNNLFYKINGNSISVKPGLFWSNVNVSNNRFAAGIAGACDVSHTGSTSTVTYSNNQYSGDSFCVDSKRQTLTQWKISGGETTASLFTGTFVDPTRTLTTYAAQQGYSTADAFLRASHAQSRLNWNTSFTANAVNEYIKNGFTVKGTAGSPSEVASGVCGSSNNQTLTAAPSSNLCSVGSASSVSSGSFYTWSCSVPGGNSVSCSANKFLALYALTTSAVNGMITSGGSYADGSVISIVASPFTGYKFSAFTGCDSVSGTTCTVTIKSNKTVSASFVPDPSFNTTSPLGTNQCNDGIDNDSDGLIDWQMDLGCEGKSGLSERAASRAEKNGFSTFDPDSTSRIIYVSNSTGNDTNDGLTPAKAVKTIVKGASLVRDGQYDFLLLKRGDVWRDQSLYDFKSGKDATHPLIIASYGSSVERPRIENDGYFIDHNGRVRSYLALIGLEFYGYKGNPADPAFNGSPRSGLRYVGTGGDFLIEDSKFVYTDFIVQTYGTGVYKNVEIRRNIVVDAYHVGTCGQNSAYRPSGIYTSHVNGLVFEGNFYDHNGWNESVPTACATMYNHNFYVNGNDMVLKDNLITRGSSMAIKTVADGVGDVNRMIIDNNFMYDGEIGISAGGNATGNYRYVDTVIKNNVFSEIGKSNNTNRSFSWGLGIQDNDRALVENNYFLNQPWYTNSYGIEISSPSLRDVTIRSNTFYNINGNALAVSPKALWSNIKVTGNTFAAPVAGACLVKHSGSFTTVAYSNNQYSSNALCVDSARQTLAQWKVSSGETTASQFVGAFSDPTRTLATYASSKGYSSVDAFLKAAQSQSRFAWNNDFTAKTINEYIKSGFVVSGNATTIENLSPVNGACGDAVKQSQVYVPTTWLCASGTASSVSSSASGYSWSCSALNGGVPASCSAGKLVTSSTTGLFWTFVVKENNSFTLVGTQTVRYGSDSTWIEKSLSGKVDCTNAFFGKDPLVGIPKQCDVLSPTGGVTGVVASLASVASTPLVLGASTLRYTWSHDLQIGKDYPEDIKALQTVLAEEGLYTGEITGGYYAETYKAVKLFQEKNGIKGTGYVGQITRNLLNSLYGN